MAVSISYGGALAATNGVNNLAAVDPSYIAVYTPAQLPYSIAAGAGTAGNASDVLALIGGLNAVDRLKQLRIVFNGLVAPAAASILTVKLLRQTAVATTPISTGIAGPNPLDSNSGATPLATVKTWATSAAVANGTGTTVLAERTVVVPGAIGSTVVDLNVSQFLAQPWAARTTATANDIITLNLVASATLAGTGNTLTVEEIFDEAGQAGATGTPAI